MVSLLGSLDWDFADSNKSGSIHSIHPYPAKFIPEIPALILETLNPPKDSVVFDPFCGSGVTLTEAQRFGYESCGVDLNPMTQGKIERYHRSMKNVVKLENYYYPWELEKAITDWVQHYNHERYHESLDNVTPSDVYHGRSEEILDQRAIIKSRTMIQRKVQNLILAG